MSLFGALDTAVAGMNVQSTALTAISDNVANSQTTGFKETNTSFIDYLTASTSLGPAPGAVVATPQYTNDQQGAVTQVSSPTSLAISGGGYFAVQQPLGGSTFSSQQLFTRVGDFSANRAGYLINSTGYALDGWPAANAAGTSFNTASPGPIQISKAPSAPVATANITLAANLPTTPPTGTNSFTSTAQVYDAAGNAQNVTMTWDQVTTVAGVITPVSASNQISATNTVTPNTWSLTVVGGSSTTSPMTVTFGATPTTAGMITSITKTVGDPVVTVPAVQTTGLAATVNLALNFGVGTQPVALNLGKFDATNGITQFAGTAYQVASQSEDAAPQGNYTSVTIKPTGDVVINYDNGSSTTVARIPLVQFNNPDGLQQQNGQTFSVSTESGNANVVNAGTGGTGTLVIGAIEGSNVDIASQFTQMIVAQRAYTANSKVVTTANAMMQDTLNMVQG